MRNGERGETARDSERRSAVQCRRGMEEEEEETKPPAKSLLTLNSRVSAITVSAAHNHGAAGVRYTNLQIKHCYITGR